jgi:hypothetical protein
MGNGKFNNPFLFIFLIISSSFALGERVAGFGGIGGKFISG